jgi:hypothetical protein
VRDFTGGKLSDGVIALSLAGAAVANDSGLLHVSAALGVPAIGMFGPTDPAKWAPINPVAELITHAPLLGLPILHAIRLSATASQLHAGSFTGACGGVRCRSGRSAMPNFARV